MANRAPEIVKMLEAGLEIGVGAAKVGSSIWKEIRHGGKDKIGSVLLQDSVGAMWKVRVRRTGKRGRYLKFSSQSPEGRKFRASADGHHPSKYAGISVSEWEVFALFAQGEKDWQGRTENEELTVAVHELLNRLVASATTEQDDDDD